MISFVVIDLPEGDYIDSYVTGFGSAGADVTQETIESLRHRYGLDQPLPVRYFKWISGIVLRNDWGHSFAYSKPVSELIGETDGADQLCSRLASVAAHLDRGAADWYLFRSQAVLGGGLCRVVPGLYRRRCTGFSDRVDCDVPGFQMDRVCRWWVVFARVLRKLPGVWESRWIC